MNNPLISIIIPVYNVEQYLKKCINSVLNQTYRDIEVILIDDGSQDNSPKICDEYAKKDGRIQVIHQTNAGVSAARNAGLEIARGAYISFVDSDDWIEPNMIETLFSMLNSSGSEIAVVDPVKQTPKQENPLFLSPKVLNSVEALKHMLCDVIIGPEVWGKLFLSSILTDIRFNTDISIGEDTLVVVKAFQEATSIVVMNYNGYHYTYRVNSTVHMYRESNWSLLTAFDLIVHELDISMPQCVSYAKARSIRGGIGFAIFITDNGKLDSKNYCRINNHIRKWNNHLEKKNLPRNIRMWLLLFKFGRTPFIAGRKFFNILKGRKRTLSQ